MDNDTEVKCRKAGMTFLPIIFETHGGGWGGGTVQLLRNIAQAQRARGVWAPEGVDNRIAQRVSVSLQREVARAILNRQVMAARVRMAPPDVVVEADERMEM